MGCGGNGHDDCYPGGRENGPFSGSQCGNCDAFGDSLYAPVWEKDALCSSCICTFGVRRMGNRTVDGDVSLPLALAFPYCFLPAKD